MKSVILTTPAKFSDAKIVRAGENKEDAGTEKSNEMVPIQHTRFELLRIPEVVFFYERRT